MKWLILQRRNHFTDLVFTYFLSPQDFGYSMKSVLILLLPKSVTDTNLLSPSLSPVPQADIWYVTQSVGTLVKNNNPLKLKEYIYCFTGQGS